MTNELLRSSTSVQKVSETEYVVHYSRSNDLSNLVIARCPSQEYADKISELLNFDSMSSGDGYQFLYDKIKSQEEMIKSLELKIESLKTQLNVTDSINQSYVNQMIIIDKIRALVT